MCVAETLGRAGPQSATRICYNEPCHEMCERFTECQVSLYVVKQALTSMFNGILPGAHSELNRHNELCNGCRYEVDHSHCHSMRHAARHTVELFVDLRGSWPGR